MSKKLLSTLIASLFAATPALAQSDDPIRVQGSGTIGGIYNNTNTFDNARLDQYQDLGNGVLSNIGAQGRNSRTWFQGYGENFGRDDQFMFLRGGMYDVFKYGAYLNDIPHTYVSNAYSPYGGIGGNVLTATFPLSALPLPQPPGNWSNFTLGTDRRDWGGYAEWQMGSPWYFRADGNQVKFSGTKYGAAANGTSPGNGYVDLAFPNETTTNNLGVEGGYQTSRATFSLRWDYSKFENDNETLQWTNPYFGSNRLDTTYLAPGNTFNKFTASGNYRDLPWKSVLSARYTWAKTTSDVPLATTALNTGAVYAPTLPHESNFDGEHINQSFALAWTATPTRGLGHARLLLLDEAAERVEHHRLWQCADAAARVRPGLRQRAGYRAEHVRAWQLRERALRLHEEQCRHRRVVEVRARPAAGLRVGLLRPDPARPRLRRLAHEQVLGRVQEHDDRQRCPPGSSTST